MIFLVEIVDVYFALFDNHAQSSLCGDWQRLQRGSAVLTLKNSIFFYFFLASHLMGHDDNFQNALNCKRYLQNIEFGNLDCTFIQASSVDKNELYCAKENTKKETKKYAYDGQKSFVFMRLFNLQRSKSIITDALWTHRVFCKMSERDDCHIVVSSGPGFCCRSCRGASALQRVSKGAITLHAVLSHCLLALELANTC